MDEKTRLLLEDMLANSKAAIEFVSGFDAARFQADRLVLYATMRAVEIVGEAASQVSAEERALLTGLPWKEAIGMRNKVIHGYRVADPQVILETVNTDFPKLVLELERALSGPAKAH